MKTRHGFVSNSSSSSFIVAFSKTVSSPENVQNEMFPNGEISLRDPYGDSRYGTERISETVYDDISSRKPAKKKELMEELSGDSYVEYPYEKTRRLWDLRRKTTDEDELDKIQIELDAVYEKHHLECEAIAKKRLAEFLDSVGKNKKIYIVSYSDNNGEYYTMMEHGDIFRNIPHIRISHH